MLKYPDQEKGLEDHQNLVRTISAMSTILENGSGIGREELYKSVIGYLIELQCITAKEL